MKREVQEITRIVSRVTEDYGEIASHSEGRYSEITSVVLPELSENFIAHFPEETNKLGEYTRRIEEHNRDYKEFRKKLVEALESYGTLVLDCKFFQSPPLICESVVKPLISYWGEFTLEGRTWPDFRNIKEVPEAADRIELQPQGWSGTLVARVRTEDDKVKYTHALREVAGNKQLQTEGTRLSSSAKQLDNEITAFRIQLLDKLDNVDKFWPGTKNYKFRKEKKNCPRCKEIFH